MENSRLNNEHELLRQIAAGNERAFAAVFENYREPVYNYLLRITKSSAIAEDILADVFMKIWVGRELMARVQNLEGFLHKVAYNKAMDFFKTTARHSRLQKIYEQRLEHVSEAGAEELVITEENRRIMFEAVNQLPPQRKMIYLLSREEGLTYEQIAEALHLSRHTVKNSITAALQTITRYIQKHYNDRTALSSLFFLC